MTVREKKLAAREFSAIVRWRRVCSPIDRATSLGPVAVNRKRATGSASRRYRRSAGGRIKMRAFNYLAAASRIDFERLANFPLPRTFPPAGRPAERRRCRGVARVR